MGLSIAALSSDDHDEEASLKVLSAAADRGLTFWDTADAYGPFHNEELIGKWFQQTGRRDEIFLATKFGIRITDGKPQLDSKPEYVRQACEASLRRLQTDHIDLYYQQRVDPQTPIERTVQGMAKLQSEGKIRYLGLSECSAKTLRRANKVHPIAAAEMEYSPFALEIESDQTLFLKTARELGVKIVSYSPLGRGFLTGTIKSRDDFDKKDMRRIHPRFSEENFASNFKIVSGLETIAKKKGCTPGQLALAWVLAQGDGEDTLFDYGFFSLIVLDIVPIPGTTRIQNLAENADAVKLTLSAEDENGIRALIESIGGVKGGRYPGAMLSWCFGDTPEL